MRHGETGEDLQVLSVSFRMTGRTIKHTASQTHSHKIIMQFTFVGLSCMFTLPNRVLASVCVCVSLHHLMGKFYVWERETERTSVWTGSEKTVEGGQNRDYHCLTNCLLLRTSAQLSAEHTASKFIRHPVKTCHSINRSPKPHFTAIFIIKIKE